MKNIINFITIVLITFLVLFAAFILIISDNAIYNYGIAIIAILGLRYATKDK